MCKYIIMKSCKCFENVSAIKFPLTRNSNFFGYTYTLCDRAGNFCWVCMIWYEKESHCRLSLIDETENLVDRLIPQGTWKNLEAPEKK